MIDGLPSSYFAVRDKSYVLSGRWILERDLTSNFQEGVIRLEESCALTDQAGTGDVTEYKLSLLTTGTDIIYYSLAKKRLLQRMQDGYHWNFDWETIDSFTNKLAVDGLEISFKEEYKLALKQEELFDDQKVFGFKCSYSGEMPKLMKELLTILNSNNYNVLDEWLSSANTEKQVYAVYGLYCLSRKGINFTTEQQRIILLIRNKKGKVNVCRGCLYSSDDIGLIVNRILDGLEI